MDVLKKKFTPTMSVHFSYKCTGVLDCRTHKYVEKLKKKRFFLNSKMSGN